MGSFAEFANLHTVSDWLPAGSRAPAGARACALWIELCLEKRIGSRHSSAQLSDNRVWVEPRLSGLESFKQSGVSGWVASSVWNWFPAMVSRIRWWSCLLSSPPRMMDVGHSRPRQHQSLIIDSVLGKIGMETWRDESTTCPGVSRAGSQEENFQNFIFYRCGGEEGGAPKLIWHINWEIMPTQCGLMETAGCCCVPLCNSGHLLANVKGTSVSTLIKDGNIWQERPRKRPVAKQLWRDSLHMWGWLCTLLDIRPDRQWSPPQTDGGWRGAAGLPVGDLTTNSGESSTI